MPRAKRKCPGGFVYHVLNRSNGKLRIFKKPEDFTAFERILAEGIERFSMRLTGYCLMSNHWHLVLWPGEIKGVRSLLFFDSPKQCGKMTDYAKSKTKMSRWFCLSCLEPFQREVKNI